jgi:hypothetical protein
MHMNDVFLHAVVNGEREALGEATAITIYDLMVPPYRRSDSTSENKQSRK